MKFWIRHNFDVFMALVMMMLLFLDYCCDMAGRRILTPVMGAITMLCLISYFMYFREIEERKRKLRIARAKAERKARREAELLEDYAGYRRACEAGPEAFERWKKEF